MTKDEIEAAAKSAGMLNPKVIPLRKLTQETVWRLWYGPDKDRKAIELPRNPDPSHVAHMIKQHKAA